MPPILTTSMTIRICRHRSFSMITTAPAAQARSLQEKITHAVSVSPTNRRLLACCAQLWISKCFHLQL
ncbi:hypothetical protein PM082_013467 [Marasmius tenuissimus]|nr:hypothetical protein PM082_013467 [Marasmius tenuissimus]